MESVVIAEENAAVKCEGLRTHRSSSLGRGCAEAG